MSSNSQQEIQLPADLRSMSTLKKFGQYPTFYDECYRCRYLLLLSLITYFILYKAVLISMAADWYNDDNASHGFFIPLISGYLIWERRQELLATAVSSSIIGLGIIVGSLALLTFGWFASEQFTMRMSLVVTLFGCSLYWFGRRTLAVLAVPLAYLVFMIPMPAIIYDTVALPLKLFVSTVSVDILKGVGVIVMREGNIIMFPSVTLEVAEACSGLRSLTALLALATAYALIFMSSAWQRLALIAAAIPVAVVTNIFRVVATGFLVRYMGVAAAEGFFHEFAGMSTFILAVVVLVGLHQLIRRVA